MDRYSIDGLSAHGGIADPDYHWPEPETDAPDDTELEGMIFESVVDATDGCQVEPDGVCPHGHPSWLLRLGLI